MTQILQPQYFYVYYQDIKISKKSTIYKTKIFLNSKI